VEGNVAASTQNQALSALFFLHQEVLHQDLGPIDAMRARNPKRLPSVLTKEEIRRVLGHLSSTHLLMAKIRHWTDDENGLRHHNCAGKTVRLDRPQPGGSTKGTWARQTTA
jgi:integrase